MVSQVRALWWHLDEMFLALSIKALRTGFPSKAFFRMVCSLWSIHTKLLMKGLTLMYLKVAFMLAAASWTTVMGLSRLRPATPWTMASTLAASLIEVWLPPKGMQATRKDLSFH